MRVLMTLCLSGVLALFSLSAAAAETPMTLMGSWTEQGETGAMLWLLTPDKISVTPVDAAGKPLAEPGQIDVLYQRAGDGWAIVARAPDGAPLGEGRAQVKDGIMLLVMPGIGTHELQRAGTK